MAVACVQQLVADGDIRLRLFPVVLKLPHALDRSEAVVLHADSRGLHEHRRESGRAPALAQVLRRIGAGIDGDDHEPPDVPDLVLLAAFGAGFTWGAALPRWS